MRSTRRWHFLWLGLFVSTAIANGANAASLANGSFETGDFSGWIATDKAAPFDPLAVQPAGAITFFNGFLGPNIVIPSDGFFAANHGFDGGTGGGIISIAQDIGIIGAGDVLTFDYRAGWDLLTFCPIGIGCGTRTFDVHIEPAGGGVPLATVNFITALGGTQTFGPNSDTGPLSGMVDLTPFAGMDVRVNFEWFMPDVFSGPANAQLDNVSIVPEPSLFAFCILGLIAAAMRIR